MFKSAYFNKIFIVFPSKKGYCLTCYDFFTATYDKNITNETSNILYIATIHYESLNSVRNFMHLRLINHSKFLQLLHCYNRLITY